MSIELGTETVRATAMLSGLEAKLSDLSPLMKNIAAALETEARLAFSSRADPSTGEVWALKADGSETTLIDTGNQVGSLNSKSSSRSAEVGYSAFYAAFHQEGTKHMVARPLLPRASQLPATWIEEINATIEEWLG